VVDEAEDREDGEDGEPIDLPAMWPLGPLNEDDESNSFSFMVLIFQFFLK